jgi:hypothetical protein
MPVFTVHVQVNRWLLVATDTKAEAEKVVWDRVNSDKIEWYDGRFFVAASSSKASKEDEAELRQATELWKREAEAEAKLQTDE